MKNQFKHNLLLMFSVLMFLALASCKGEAHQDGYTISGTAKGLDNKQMLLIEGLPGMTIGNYQKGS